MFETKIEQIKRAGLYRQMKYLQSPQNARIRIAGRDILMLSSNSYLGLCSDERLKQAAREAMELYGAGSGGSRLITGSYEIHQKLEDEIAAFKKTQAALIFNTGYMANLGVISAIADSSWVIFSDRLNHASIIDGCRLAGAQTVIYEHCDPADLETKVKKHHGRQGLIITDGLFSVDGDIAPLPPIVEIAKRYNLLLMVDEAHATGVMGIQGAGVADHFGLSDSVDISVGTFSKALASEGGFVAGSRGLIDYLANTARSFIFSTALAPATIAVSLAALHIVKSEPQRRDTLLAHGDWFRARLSDLGFTVTNHPTPIISVVLGAPDLAVAFSDALMEKGIFVSAIRPPTVPSGSSRLRINLMATHTREDLEPALDCIEAVGHKLGAIKVSGVRRKT